MNVTYYGHSCILIQVNGKNLLFDPFITDNALAANIDIAKINADYIFISHGHEDHISDVSLIAKRTNAVVVSNFEILEWLTSKHQIQNTHPMNIGGKWKFDFGADDAIIAADFIRCNNIIGIHYDTFEYIKINHKAAQEIFFNAGKTLMLPEIGKTFKI